MKAMFNRRFVGTAMVCAGMVLMLVFAHPCVAMGVFLMLWGRDKGGDPL